MSSSARQDGEDGNRFACPAETISSDAQDKGLCPPDVENKLPQRATAGGRSSESAQAHSTANARHQSDQTASPAIDIEHEAVDDDPRLWSARFKWSLVVILCAGALIPTMGANIFFPAINDVKMELHASDSQIALSVSLFILAQGIFPLLWSPLSEIIGRKPCFLSAMGIFTVCMAIIGGATKNVAMLIAFRVIGAAGSAALLAISAGTLADMYEPAERGVKVGIYYCAPLLGPAVAPIFGGLLTEAGAAPGQRGIAGWRLTFIFLAACGAACFICYCFFRETFRAERSLAWQKARREALQKTREGNVQTEGESNRAKRNSFRTRISSCFSVRRKKEIKETAVSDGTKTNPLYVAPPLSRNAHSSSAKEWNSLAQRPSTRHSISRLAIENGKQVKYRPRLADVSPLGSALAVCKQPHNMISLCYSGLAFASQYSLTYTATRTFTAAPYHYNPIYIGLVLLSIGGPGMIGSILGGRLSDRALVKENARLEKEQEAGAAKRAAPEIRIMTVRIPMLICPLAFVGYAWAAEQKTNIAAPVVCLVFLGFSLFWIYSSTLSYVVDSNTGRSTGAVACNSAVRGLFAFIASEVAGPIQDAVGDGALYTGWAILLALGQIGLLVVGYRGERWRQSDWRWPKPWKTTRMHEVVT